MSIYCMDYITNSKPQYSIVVYEKAPARFDSSFHCLVSLTFESLACFSWVWGDCVSCVSAVVGLKVKLEMAGQQHKYRIIIMGGWAWKWIVRKSTKVVVIPKIFIKYSTLKGLNWIGMKEKVMKKSTACQLTLTPHNKRTWFYSIYVQYFYIAIYLHIICRHD